MLQKLFRFAWTDREKILPKGYAIIQKEDLKEDLTCKEGNRKRVSSATHPTFEQACAALSTPGIAERWQAVQERLHPYLAELANHVADALHQRFPYQWHLYERSYKSQRYINRGQGKRSPIEEYHVAFDRPPRGCGLLISVNGAEHLLLVGLQLWGIRKQELARLWANDAFLWRPLIARIEQEGDVRFKGWKASQQQSQGERQPDQPQPTWLDRYLASRTANYLWAGFRSPWDALPDNLTEQVREHMLALFPLNEALMEQAESGAFVGRMTLREERAPFSVSSELPEIEQIVEHIQSQSVAFSETIIRAYHVALQTRPLVILPGISGTGKTLLTRLYADAVHAIPSTAHPNPYYLIVAVQPDWHNARDLLGYYNALTGLYHPTPFLRFLLKAVSDPQQRYFICLDEMNLARPEYYLAPLLSALETTEHTIDLGIPAEEAQTVTGETLRQPFRLPLNISLTGTVNVDESTHMLSDKLLDRANVIEMTEVDLTAFRASHPVELDESLWQIMSQVHALVARAGHTFGYRTLREMVHYIEQARGTFSTRQALDLQVKQKVLPKMRGEDIPHFRQALQELLTLLSQEQLSDSREKVQRMLDRLDDEGFTDFYGY